MVDGGVWLGTGLHGLKPVHQVAYVIIVRAERVGRRGSGHLDQLLAVFCGPNDGEFCVDRSIVEWIEFLPATFARDRKKRSTFPAVVLDGACSSANPRKAAVAVSKYRLIGVEKTLWIHDCSDACIGIFPSIFPGEDSAVGNDAFRISFPRPEMHEVAGVA